MRTSQYIDTLIEQTTLAEAADLARAGRFQEAESLLAGLLQGKGTSIPVLNLLARIRSQQGRLAEAESLWKQGLQADPLNEACLAGIYRIAHMQRPFWLVFGMKVLTGAVAIIILSYGIWALWNAMHGLASQAKVTANMQQQTLAQVSELRKVQAGLTKTLETLLAQSAIGSPASQGSANQASLPPDLNLKVKIPGIVLRTEDGHSVISFAEGLFRKGVKLRPEARTQLTALGNQLAPYKDRISLQVTGYTDDLPIPEGKRYLDNNSLGLSRAMVVVEHLRATTDLSRVSFTTSGSGHAPHPNNNHRNRLRNRTVTMRIMPSQPKDQ